MMMTSVTSGLTKALMESKVCRLDQVNKDEFNGEVKFSDTKESWADLVVNYESISIYGFNGWAPGSGRQWLVAIKRHFGESKHVAAFGVAKNSYGFWLKMFNEGLIDEARGDEGEELFYRGDGNQLLPLDTYEMAMERVS